MFFPIDHDDFLMKNIDVPTKHDYVPIKKSIKHYDCMMKTTLMFPLKIMMFLSSTGFPH